MKNTDLIYAAALDHGYTAEQLNKMVIDSGGDLPLHTFQEWKSRGYSVKKGEHAVFDCALWKYTSRASKTARLAAAARGEDEPENSGHFYLAKAYIFDRKQVERIQAAEA